MQQSIETETEKLLKKIQNDPEEWLGLKRLIFIGLIITWNQPANLAEKFAEQFGETLVKYFKNEKYETAGKEEELKNIFKNSLLLHQKDESLFKNILATAFCNAYSPKDAFETFRQKVDFKIFTRGNWNNESVQKFKRTFARNIDQLEKCVLDEINSKKLKNEMVTEYLNQFAFTLFLIFLWQVVGAFLKVNLNTYITVGVIGGVILIGKNFNDIHKMIKFGDAKISQNINLELKKSYQLPSKYRKTKSYNATPKPASEPTFIFEMKPVSYLPSPPVEKPVVESTTQKKPFTHKGRHESKIDIRTFEERMDAIAIKSSSTLDSSSTTTASSTTTSFQESAPLKSEETPTFELTPADFGYPELKQKYLTHIQGAGFFIFNKYEIKRQALKEGHEKQYKDLKKTYVDKSSQRLARPEGQSGNVKLANEAGYEFKTTHGAQRALFFNNTENIAKAEKVNQEKVHRYTAKVYNEYSPEGLHSGKGL